MAARPDTDWHVRPHEPMQALARNLWRVEGALDGMPLTRQMVVVQVDGRLLLHSAIAMDEAGMTALETLGRPAWMVVPSAYHRLDAPRYKARYPGLQVFAPRGARKAVAKRVAVDATYDEAALPGDAVTLEHLDGLEGREGVMRVRSEDGVTLVFTDALFNLPHAKGLFWWVYGRLMGNAGGPRVTTVARTFIVSKKRAYRAHLERLAEIPDLRRLVPGHGDVVDSDVAGVLRAVAASL